MKIRQLVFPGTEWYARRPARSAVNLTRPSLATVLPAAVLVLIATLLAATADGGWIRSAWAVVAIGALVRTASGVWRHRRPGEAMLVADDARLIYARTPTGRITPTVAGRITSTVAGRITSTVAGQADETTDEQFVLLIAWDTVLATAATPTGVPWWDWRQPRLHLDLFVAPDSVTSAMSATVVDVDPPATDLPRSRLRFPIPRFSQQRALNLLRWYSPHLLVDPVTGGSALFLEPDGDPWPDITPETPGSRQVPIPAGPILGLPAAAVPITEWAPPEPPTLGFGRPDFEAAGGGAHEAAAPSSAAPVPLRGRPPHVAVFGHLGRITGAGRAWRIGWLVARLFSSLALLLVFVVLGIVGLTSPDVPGSVVVISAIFSLWFALGVWRYSWRLLRLRDGAAGFIALTPGGVRVVDAASYASIPWRVIQQATLRTVGRHSWLCLAIDANAPCDVSWAVLRAPTSAQTLPGCTVLWLQLPTDEADPRRLGPGLWAGGSVPFNAGFWPGPISG